MPVQSHGGGWRARKKHAGQWFIGPLRQTRLSAVVERHSTGWRLRCGTKEHRRCGPTRRDKAMAQEDARRVADALRVSPQEADRVFRQLTDKTVMVERHSTGWRLRCGTKEHRRCGPTRRDKAAAEEDARRVADCPL